MPKSDLADESRVETQQAGPVDLLIGISGAVGANELQQHAKDFANGFQKQTGISSTVIAYPGTLEVQANSVNGGESQLPHFVSYPFTAPDPTSPSWVVAAAAQRAICSLAKELDAKVCLVLRGDLAMLIPEQVQLLMQPVLDGKCDLVLPIYPLKKFEALLNHSILAPLARALYGQRVRHPLAPDFSCSARMFQKLSESSSHSDGGLLWPATYAATSSYQVCQVNVNVQHATQTEGLELSTVLSSIAGAAFSEMERYASYWQRVRNSQPTATAGNLTQVVSDGEPVDAKPLIDSFLLGSRNLQEVWGLVLPPVTLLELKKLTRCGPESFRMPDELWVRIIYDFALAYRLRTINRGHLMGALTPLYLGWVASYVLEMAARSPLAAEQRFEQLARAYEEGKPYLVSRWRWPDRFNP